MATNARLVAIVVDYAETFGEIRTPLAEDPAFVGACRVAWNLLLEKNGVGLDDLPGSAPDGVTDLYVQKNAPEFLERLAEDGCLKRKAGGGYEPPHVM